MTDAKLQGIAESDDSVEFERRRNTKPYWAARHFDGLYHAPCDDGSTFGPGQMSYSDGSYRCECGYSVRYQ